MASIRSTITAFVQAGKDLSQVTEDLQAISVNQSMTANHTGFLEKIDLVFQLYNEKLSKALGGVQIGDSDSTEESLIERLEIMDGCDQELVERYDLALYRNVSITDASTEDVMRKMQKEADMLIKKCLQHGSENQSPETYEEPEPIQPVENTVQEVLEGVLDTMINSLQRSPKSRKAIKKFEDDEEGPTYDLSESDGDVDSGDDDGSYVEE